MEKNEQVLDELKALGFVINKIPEYGYVFDYEDSHILCPTIDEDDSNFIRLAIPYVFEVNDDNRAFLENIVNKVNIDLKYVKAVIMNDNNIWVLFEHYSIGEYPLDELLAMMIRSLDFSRKYILKYINGDVTDDACNTGEDNLTQSEIATEVE